MPRSLASGTGRTSGPILISTFGLALISARMFHPDAALGFPPGTPDGPAAQPTGQSSLHGLSFLCIIILLIGACLVFVRRFGLEPNRGGSRYSLATGLVTPLLISTAFATNIWLVNTLVGLVSFG